MVNREYESIFKQLLSSLNKFASIAIDMRDDLGFDVTLAGGDDGSDDVDVAVDLVKMV